MKIMSTRLLVGWKKKIKSLILYWLVCEESDAFPTSITKDYNWKNTLSFASPVGWGCRIYQQHLCRWIRPPPNEYPGCDIKPSDGEARLLEIWEMWSTSSLLLLPGPLWLAVVAPDRVLSMGQIELFNYLNCVQTNDLC